MEHTFDRLEHPLDRLAKKRENLRRWRKNNPDRAQEIKRERDEAIRLCGILYAAWKTKQSFIALADYYQLQAIQRGTGIFKLVDLSK